MPANLTPEYKRAEERFRQATTASEKTEALEDMLRTIPKHKGTEHMRADLKRRLAKLRDEGSQKKGKGGFDPFHVEKHGAGQIVVVGMPNSGKSALVGAVTGARVNTAPFPFATHAPVPGMMPFEDIQIQLVDMPPLQPDGFLPGMIGALRVADAIMVCLDLASDALLEQAEWCFEAMRARGLVRAGEEVPEGGEAKPMLTVGTRCDLPGAADNLAVLQELRPDLRDILPTSAEKRTGLADLAAAAFRLLDIVRVYTKQPGQEADLKAPYTLRRGSTVTHLAAAVHRELADDLKYARVWGSAKFDGQPVQRDHVLEDKDIVELHAGGAHA
jgi:ribosome-interacting GTPase 1